LSDQPTSSVVNLTGHKVRIVSPDRTVTDIPPSGQVARCVQDADWPVGSVAVGPVTVPIVISPMSTVVVGLPDHRPGVLLVVSRTVATAQPHRRDLVFPHDILRDDNGHPLGCRAFGQVPAPTAT
jgi:hypothetical protein